MTVPVIEPAALLSACDANTMQVSDLHPIIDHFSIALVILGILTEYYGFLTERPGARSFGWTLVRLSLVFLVLSLLTGLVADQSATMDSAAKPIASYHRITAFIAFALVGVGVLVRSLARDSFLSDKGASVRGAYLAIISIALVLSTWTVYLGMELVYGHGVNVRPYEHLIQSLPPTAPSTTGPLDSMQTSGPLDTTHH